MCTRQVFGGILKPTLSVIFMSNVICHHHLVADRAARTVLNIYEVSFPSVPSPFPDQHTVFDALPEPDLRFSLRASIVIMFFSGFGSAEHNDAFLFTRAAKHCDEKQNHHYDSNKHHWSLNKVKIQYQRPKRYTSRCAKNLVALTWFLRAYWYK